MRGHWRGWTWAALLALTLIGLPSRRAAAQEGETADTEGSQAAGEAAEGAPAGAESPGETEEERTERARALFSEGIELVEAQRWDEAIAKFRATLELKESPSVRYNLASALYADGQMTEAEVLVDGVLDDPETDEDVRGHAQELQTMLREEGGAIRVELAGNATGATVAIDEYQLPDNRIATDVAASPGAHVVTATRDGNEVAREEATVTAGETTTVRMDVAPTPETTAAAGLQPSGGEEPSGSSSSNMLSDWRLWAAVGGAVVVVAVVVVVAATAGGGTQDPVEGNFEPGVLRW